MVRAYAPIVLVAFLACMPIACNTRSEKASFATVGKKIGAADARAEAAAELHARVGDKDRDKDKGGDKEKGGDKDKDRDRDKGGDRFDKDAAKVNAKDAPAKVAPGQQAPPGAPAAGQLTAGSFDDSLRFDIFQAFLRRIGNTSLAADWPARFQGRQLVLTITSAEGAPIHNARVKVSAGGAASVDLLSRTDGRVVIVTPWDRLENDSEWTVTITPPDGGNAVVRKIDQQTRAETIVLEQTKAVLPEALDLALVLDTTGSMGDELEYLKSEMKWIASTIKERFPNVKQRYALICYRDLGDEYVTRTFAFTDNLDHFNGNLSRQKAAGGGDTPEAVHKAMEQAVQLDWRPGRTARVLVHVADAPPHRQDFDESLKHVDRLRKSGVAFYPLACSGYDPPCEFLMRASALLTGGQFLFLTDDSGIGNAHAEPTTNGYHVEHLNKLLVRMIASELSGRRVLPEQGDIIRTVGVPQLAVKR